jgi:hypothetical protein
VGVKNGNKRRSHSASIRGSFERKDHLEKVFVNLEVQKREIMNVTMEWKDFKKYFVDLD